MPRSLVHSQSREQVNNVRMGLRPMWHEPGNILDGKGSVTVQQPNELAISSVRIKTSLLSSAAGGALSPIR